MYEKKLFFFSGTAVCGPPLYITILYYYSSLLDCYTSIKYELLKYLCVLFSFLSLYSLGGYLQITCTCTMYLKVIKYFKNLSEVQSVVHFGRFCVIFRYNSAVDTSIYKCIA